MEIRHTIRYGISALVFVLSGQLALAEDICSDAYMTRKIQPYAAKAQSAVGVCGTAKAGIQLYRRSLELVKPCEAAHADLRAYKLDLQRQLRDAERQAAASCG